MNIYDCKTVSEYYKIVKKYYAHFEDLHIRSLTGNEIQKILNFLIMRLNNGSMLDFSFVKTY
ncbi:hypothetical protein, partial [Flavobacterium sp.]|uniref:hypothetical protein n=1 Tax=Flavobacterium sp. TaxID=239 RepID=UPI0037BEA8B2